MIPNALIVLIGLWLSYSAIFTTYQGTLNNLALGIAGAVIAVSAALAWRRDIMSWQSTSNVVLGIGLATLAVTRIYVGVSALALFWIILLAGIAVAIGALWSILYGSDAAMAA